MIEIHFTTLTTGFMYNTITFNYTYNSLCIFVLSNTCIRPFRFHANRMA